MLVKINAVLAFVMILGGPDSPRIPQPDGRRRLQPPRPPRPARSPHRLRRAFVQRLLAPRGRLAVAEPERPARERARARQRQRGRAELRRDAARERVRRGERRRVGRARLGRPDRRWPRRGAVTLVGTSCHLNSVTATVRNGR